MELSPEDNIQDTIQDLKLDKNNSFTVPTKGRNLDCDILNEVMDISKIHFEDDEHWLYKSLSVPESQIENLNYWLHSNVNGSHDELLSSNSTESPNQKIFDSRTFTRPKKRFIRPSIEKYNEVVYGIDNNSDSNNLSSSRESLGGISTSYTSKNMLNETSKPEPTRPLSFDLSQPSNSYYFENMLANIRDNDSFQNMSPPSLVNSICSTTFANLMESSFIKNDPVLREIRDTDFTENILLQDSEAPMFHSITESCSSLNSDTPESFLKKVSRSETFKKKPTFDLSKSIDVEELSNTYQVNRTYDNSNTEIFDEAHTGSIDFNKTISPSNNVNETYSRTPKMESFQNTKPLLIKRSLIRENTIEDLKKQLNDTVQITDMNRLSYCLDTKGESVLNETHQVIKTVDIKRSSISTGSTDSLDRMSSVSNSSRGSNRMLSMADVDAIVEMQEKSLQQVMSTPKINTVPKKFLVNNFISPINSNDNLSDSDMSSSEDYKSVRSSPSKGSLDSYGQSRHYFTGNETKTMPMQQPIQKMFKSNVSKNSKKNDGVNNRPKSNVEVNVPITNLKLMGQKLKASYTSLKPMSTNLPVVPPLNVAKTLTRPKKTNVNETFDAHTKVVEVPPMPRERVPTSDNHVFVKPVHPKSSLPRPTGIPRPSSRIPAPRSGIRPASSKYSTNMYETRESYQ